MITIPLMWLSVDQVNCYFYTVHVTLTSLSSGIYEEGFIIRNQWTIKIQIPGSHEKLSVFKKGHKMSGVWKWGLSLYKTEKSLRMRPFEMLSIC